jgi:CysZ protein
MGVVLKALLLALGDLPRPQIMRLLAQSFLITLLLLGTIGGAIFWGLGSVIDRIGYAGGQMGPFADVLTALIAIAAMWLLFRAVAIFVIGFFADALIEGVERRHYPAATMTARPVGMALSLRLGLRSVGRFLGVNTIALPFYALLLPTAIGLPILALLINGWLLGHDLEAMVQQRHPSLPKLSAPARWGLGLLSAASLSVPIVNFLAPLLSAAMATHLFHLRPEVRI